MEDFGEYGFFVTLDEENKSYTNKNKYKRSSKDTNRITQTNDEELLYNHMEMKMEMEMEMEIDNIYTLIIDHIKCVWIMFKFFIRDRTTI